MKKAKYTIALLLTFSLIFTLLSCRKPDVVLVIGTTANFSAKWNPYIAENQSDTDVMSQIFVPVMILNSDNELIDYGGSCTWETLPNGNVQYTVSIKEGMKFTDGKPVTIDDYLYGVYVRSDPSYTGPNNTWSLKIVGINEFLFDTPNYSELINGIKARCENISFEDFMLYAKGTDLDGWWDGGEWADTDYTWIDYIKDEGYEDDLALIDDTDTNAVFELVTKIEYQEAADAYDAAGWLMDTLKAEIAKGNLSDGVDVPEIEGIKKISDYACTIEYYEKNIYADRDLCLDMGVGWLTPSHYYGEFKKGDVSKVLSNMKPIGSGPYTWIEYADNIVTLKANEDFFLGQPVTPNLRYQFVPESDLLEAMATGTIDISEPDATSNNLTEMNSLGLKYDLTENDGYGYMGMNCENLPLYVRKGIWSIMNRDPSVEGYYGAELAKVIERPMTTILAEYPNDAKRVYEYSREKALEYFNQAGYTQVNGKLVNASGEQLIVNVYIGGEGEGDHPAYAMLIQASEDLAALGGELQIQDVNFSVLSAAMDDGIADMYILAWAAVNSCDKMTTWHSSGGQNKTHWRNAKADELMEKIPQTISLDTRRALVAQLLDLAVEECVEYPLYQRNNVVAYNPQTINMSTVPKATTFYKYKQEVWKIEVLEESQAVGCSAYS